MQTVKYPVFEEFYIDVMGTLTLEQASKLFDMIEHYSPAKMKLIADLIKMYPDKYRKIADRTE